MCSGLYGTASRSRLDAALVADQHALDVGRERDERDPTHDLLRGQVASHGVDRDAGTCGYAPSRASRCRSARASTRYLKALRPFTSRTGISSP